MRRWIVCVAAAAGIAGLAAPAFANVSVPVKHGKPVTAAQCKSGGGSVMMGKCKGGSYDGDTVSG
jgi:hypothetical protein